MRFVTVIFLLLLSSSLLLVGCGNLGRDFRETCGDNVRFSVQRPTNYDFEVCYDNRGAFEFILLNQGSVNITGVIIKVEGTNSSLTSNHPVVVSPGGAQLFTMNLQLSTFGNINSMSIYPQINSEGVSRTCLANKVVYKKIKLCTDLPLY